MTVWYVVVRRDNGYPLLVYPSRERAELVTGPNDCDVIAVEPREMTVVRTATTTPGN